MSETLTKDLVKETNDLVKTALIESRKNDVIIHTLTYYIDTAEKIPASDSSKTLETILRAGYKKLKEFEDQEPVADAFDEALNT